MGNKSTSDVILAIRQHSNTVRRQVVTDDEVLARANEGLWELYDLIDGAHNTYFVKPHSFSLTGGYGANTAPLPSDFYRAKALDKSPDTSAMHSVDPLPSFTERNNPQTRCYDLEDVSNIILLPPTLAQGDYRLRYIPKCPQLGLPIVVDSTNPPAPLPPSPIPVPSVDAPPTLLTGRLLGSVSNNQCDLMVQALNTWLAGGWFVVQSYDASGVIPAPGVNTWTDYTKLRGASGGGGTGGSWIVLGNPWNASQVCLYCTVSSSTTGWAEFQIIGAAGGGFTGGTTLARPTASHEMQDNVLPSSFLGTGPVGNPQFYAVTWVAPDGSYLRAAWLYGGKLKSFWNFEQLKFGPSGWTTPFLVENFHWGNPDYTVTGLRALAAQFTLNWGNGGVWKQILTPTGTPTLEQTWGSLEYAVGAGWVTDQANGANGFSNQYPWIAPMGHLTAVAVAPHNGFWGYSRDQYWTQTFNDGDTAGDNYDLIIFGQMMLQWGLGPVGARLGGSSTNYPSARWQGRNVQ